MQRWVFNFGTLGFLFVFFIRQSALQPFTRNKKSETISNTHWLTLFLRCCNYKHTSVDLIRLFCAVPATHTPRKRRNRPLMSNQTPSELSQTPSEFTIPKVPHPSAALTFPPQPQPSAALTFPELEGRAEAVEDTFNAQNVANTLWAYATMGRAAGARGGLDEGAGGAVRGAGGTPISDRCSPWSPSSGEFLGSTQVELWNAKHMSQSDHVDDSQDTGSPVFSAGSRIAAASRRLHMGTSPVAGSALPKRNTLLHPPQAFGIGFTLILTRSSPSRHPPFTQYPSPSRSLVRD